MTDEILVPRQLIEEIIDALEKVASKSITANNGTHQNWLRKKIRKLEDVLGDDERES